MDRPGKVTSSAHGQLNREINVSLSPFMPEDLVLRDGFGRSVPHQPAHSPHSGSICAYSRDTSRFPRCRTERVLVGTSCILMGSTISNWQHVSLSVYVCVN